MPPSFAPSLIRLSSWRTFPRGQPGTQPRMPIRRAVLADVPSLFDVRTSVLENHMSAEALVRVGVTPDTVTAMLGGDSRAWVAEEMGSAWAVV